MAVTTKAIRRKRIKFRIRKKISGTPARPRLTVFRSNRHIYAQVIDDLAGRTLASASTLEEGVEGKQTERSGLVGKRLAERAREAGIEQVLFDRNGFRYHGRVRALADGAREGGLQF
jgi:large subunit ribosomal protein L18